MPAASLRHFVMPDHGAASPVCSAARRDWVLLDTESYFGYCKNETTAAAWTSAGHAVEFSVVLADPPAISRCFIHCDGPTAEQFAGETFVIASEGAFLLLCMAFSPPASYGRLVRDFFVYTSGPGSPSLYLLPRPYPESPLNSNRIAVLPSVSVDGEHFRVVAYTGRFGRRSAAYDLDEFSSSSKLWTTRRIPVCWDAETCYYRLIYHQTSKAISLGGGCLGWVDLWQGILICDVLADEPAVRLMRLPEPEPGNKLESEMGFRLPSARAIRDVTCSDGVVRFVEILQDGNGDGGWVATIWCREVTSRDWSSCLKVDSCDIRGASSCLPCLLPDEMCDMETNKVNLSKVISTCPTLGLHDDGVMYMMCKLNAEDPRTFVLVIDTQSKTLEGIAEVSNERIYDIGPTYLPCIFSSYISLAPAADMANQLVNNFWSKKQEHLTFYVMMVLLAQDQFRQIERSFSYKPPSYNECRSLLHSGLATSLHVHVQELAQHATNNGLGKAATEAVTMYLRALQDVDALLLKFSCDIPSVRYAIIDKVSVALGALDSLLQTIPSEALDKGRAHAVAFTDYYEAT